MLIIYCDILSNIVYITCPAKAFSDMNYIQYLIKYILQKHINNNYSYLMIFFKCCQKLFTIFLLKCDGVYKWVVNSNPWSFPSISTTIHVYSQMYVDIY